MNATRMAGLATVGVLAALLAACGSTAPSTSTLRGTVLPGSALSSVFGVAAETYQECANAQPAPGTQVTVTDPSGKVIGTAVLRRWLHQTVKVNGLTATRARNPSP